MTKELVFYTNPMSRGLIVKWMLEEVGVDYETRNLEYGDEMKSAEYRAINPMGKVPAIQHGDQIVTECAAICAYLADAFPQAGLAPVVDQRGEYYRWLFFAAGPVESAITNKHFGVEVNEEQQRMAGYGTYDLTMSVLDDLFANRRYVCGDNFTAVDVYLGSHIDWGIAFGTIQESDNFNGYLDRIRKRTAYQKARTEEPG